MRNDFRELVFNDIPAQITDGAAQFRFRAASIDVDLNFGIGQSFDLGQTQNFWIAVVSGLNGLGYIIPANEGFKSFSVIGALVGGLQTKYRWDGCSPDNFVFQKEESNSKSSRLQLR